ncbi:hypothetical protein CDAR_200591 [Caerostris darwini]|uniref:Uncharacterized protein n=1 Tax=Caerostris darwini TaxID=1538125 RepID=A0AAV4NQA2_9ARAC|nr:hypothetical protein CDAR_200591 [Caerostris darwini]
MKRKIFVNDLSSLLSQISYHDYSNSNEKCFQMNCPALRKTPTQVTNSKTFLIQTLLETRKKAVLFALCAKVMEKEHSSFYSSTNEAISFSGHQIWLWARKVSFPLTRTQVTVTKGI